MAIDERAVIEAVAGLQIAGNDEGLIPAFGLYLTRHLADYYNRISFETAHRLDHGSLADDVRALLVEAGHGCAFNTFGGIMKSAEWDAVVRPMIESREDWVRGMVAVVNAFGWGRWQIRDLEPGQSLTVRITDSYEAAGYVRDYGASDRPRCYLAAGGVAGLMNLLYVGDITTRPALDEAYYRELFRGPARFVADEVACAAAGAPACEIVARHAAGLEQRRQSRDQRDDIGALRGAVDLQARHHHEASARRGDRDLVAPRDLDHVEHRGRAAHRALATERLVERRGQRPVDRDLVEVARDAAVPHVDPDGADGPAVDPFSVRGHRTQRTPARLTSVAARAGGGRCGPGRPGAA